MTEAEVQSYQLEAILDQVDDITNPELMSAAEAAQWLDELIYDLQVRRGGLSYDLAEDES